MAIEVRRFYAIAEQDYADPERRCWTVSEDPEWPGWGTDSGCAGYGLTKAQAQFLAEAANEKIARDGDPDLPRFEC
jgi:hypothetical protein